jgi:hypothetical protein
MNKAFPNTTSFIARSLCGRIAQWLAGLTVLILLPSCAEPPAPKPAAPKPAAPKIRWYRMIMSFRESEMEPYRKHGTASITGQAFHKTQGGEIRSAAGIEIILMPGTSFFREFFGIALNEFIGKLDPYLIMIGAPTLTWPGPTDIDAVIRDTKILPPFPYQAKSFIKKSVGDVYIYAAFFQRKDAVY